MSSEVAAIFRVLFWSGVLALGCWLAVMTLEAIPSFRESSLPRPDDDIDAAADAQATAGPRPSH